MLVDTGICKARKRATHSQVDTEIDELNLIRQNIF